MTMTNEDRARVLIVDNNKRRNRIGNGKAAKDFNVDIGVMAAEIAER